MKKSRTAAIAIIQLGLLIPPALAQGKNDKNDKPAEEDHEAPSLDDEPVVTKEQLVEQEIAELRDRLKESEEGQRNARSPLTVRGYADLGFFVPRGNGGAGWVRDAGHAQFPQYSGYAWTFLGDILATTINSRGEVADLGEAPGVERFDSVHSRGAPGFLVNEVNLRLAYALSDRAILRSSVDFMPRTGQNFSIGDFVELDQAELEYVLTRDGKTSVFVGKSLPTFGIEYKERKSDQRFGITPSLVERYTSGPEIGVKIRSKLLHDWLVLAASATNGSSVTEQFHFASEIDQNSGKTLTGRVALSAPLGELGGERLELGFSGEWGPQDRATDLHGDIWFLGADLQYLGSSLFIKAQAMRGGAPGRYVDRAWGLALRNSGYLELDWLALANFGLVLRAEARDAFVTLGTERAYLTKEARFTGGLRYAFNSNVIVKAEYLHNKEYGGITEFMNDVFTSSLVLAF